MSDLLPPPIYDSNQYRLPILRELRDLIQYHDLLWVLIDKTIKTRYKRSALGVLWTLLNPLLTTLVLSLAFSHFFKFDTPNYAIYLLSGLLVWNFFSQTSLQAISTLIWGSALLKRIYVPRSIFVLSIVGNSLVNLGFALVVLLILMIGMQQPFRLALITLPFSIILLSAFTLGVSLILGTASVFSADLVDVVGVAWQVLFYLSPVIYPIASLPDSIRWLIALNPITSFLELLRQPVYYGLFPNATSWLWAIAWALGSLLAGALIFTQNSSRLAYEL